MTQATLPKPSQEFTIKQLSSANTNSKKALVAIRGKVYDVTNFGSKHPGGEDFLMAAVGRDATAVFESFHSPKAIKVLAKREVGTLVESDMPQYPKQSSFQQELRMDVAKYFDDISKDPRNAPWMLVPYCISIFAYIISYAVMFSPSLCRGYQPIPWLAALAHGWSSAMLGLYLQHDGCHASFSRSPFIWNVMRRLYELMTGLSSAVWIHQHVLGHHPFTNVIDIDPDIIQSDPGPVRIHTSQPWWSYYSWQSYYWIPLYSQLVLSRRLSEWKNLFIDHKFKSITINPVNPTEYFWAGSALISFMVLHLIIPFFYLQISFMRIMLTYACCDGFWSLYLMLVFQASHVNDEVSWPQPDKDEQLQDWAICQIESSMDFAHGSWLTTFLVGSLNYQAVHHLFPHVSQFYYPALAPIVQRACAKHNVKYNLRGSLSEALALHVKRLVNLGTEPTPIIEKLEVRSMEANRQF